MRKKNLKSKLMLMGLIAAVLIIIALIVILVLGKKSLDKSKEQVTMLSEELTNNKQLVYVASRDIKKGEQVDADSVMEQMIYTGLGPSSYMAAENLGQTAIVDIKANEPVMANMVTAIQITNDMRRYEVATAHLMTTQQEYDTVDVRIMFPNGEDYLLLAKKTIMNLQMGTSIFTTYMNEDEILRMSSAIVDAYTTTGAKIYTVKYVEENIQKEAIPNYLVKASVLDLINNDPNIVDIAETTLNLRARNDLDQRLGALTDEQLKAVASGLDIEDTAKASVIREGLIREEANGGVSGNEVPEPTPTPTPTPTPEPSDTPPGDQPVYDYDEASQAEPADDDVVTFELSDIY